MTELEDSYAWGLVSLFAEYSLYASGIKLLDFKVYPKDILNIHEQAFYVKRQSINEVIRLVLDHLVDIKIMTSKDRDSYMRKMRKL